MVFGIRVSYHDAQMAGSKNFRQRPPICTCTACFDKEEHDGVRAACQSPAKELRIPHGDYHVPNIFSRLRGHTGTARHGHNTLGVSLLGRTLSGQSVATVASARPLRTAAQDVPRTSGDVKGVVDEVLQATEGGKHASA